MLSLLSQGIVLSAEVTWKYKSRLVVSLRGMAEQEDGKSLRL